MSYSISEVSKKIGISISAIRYYEAEGLLPFVERNESGQRRFKDSDLSRLRMIDCLKKIGMSIGEMREYFDLYMEGDGTLHRRLELMHNYKKNVEQRIQLLKEQLYKIECKIWYYETAEAAGTESIHNDEYCVDLYERHMRELKNDE